MSASTSARPREERYFTIVNPAAGGGRCGARADAALERLDVAGLALDVRRTTRAGEATELARTAWADGYRRFLCVGGDGTSYEVVNGLFPLAGGERPRLGMLPLGTGNSFLRDFGITRAEEALVCLGSERTRPCDVVRVIHDDGVLHFINLLSIGFSAEAGALTNRRYKRLGAAGYVVAVLQTAAHLRYPSFAVSLDGAARDERPCVLLSFSNSRYTGGTMMMAPHADPTDGELDVIRIGEMSRARFVGAFPSIFAGRHVERPEVEERRVTRVDLDLSSPIDAMIDGEVQRLRLRSLEVLPGALEVVA